MMTSQRLSSTSDRCIVALIALPLVVLIGGVVSPAWSQSVTPAHKSGAPRPEETARPSGKSEAISKPGKTHWAFQRPIRPAVPRVKNAAWVRNPIDAVIAAEHEKRGLT